MAQSVFEGPRQRRRASDPQRTFVRLVSYNVHSCIGLDGKLSPARIARVLASLDPDIVALQELDVRRSRTGGHDQAELIARLLGMDRHFSPAMNLVGEQYGDAILSRFPMTLRKACLLPGQRPGREPRGALWVSVAIGDQSLNVITTHLGLSPAERDEQISALLGADWVQHPALTGPLVLCGDFNANPSSRVYRRATAQLRDAQLAVKGVRPARTWFSPWPLARIDHVFISPEITTHRADVVRTTLARVASDHLPLVVDIALPLAGAAEDGQETSVRFAGFNLAAVQK
jgi:endonuclease/exonuclease/phosphatase family metal-dependent hydrolase